MKIIEIMDLYTLDYSVEVINALGQRRKYFSCIGAPKKCHMLLYLDGCRAVYTKKSGEKLYAENGQIVYLPMGAEYSVEFFDFSGKDSRTVHINFRLYERDEPFALSEGVEIFGADNENYGSLFNNIDRFSEANIRCHGKIKALMYEILFGLSEFYRKDYRNKFAVIAKGITYLEQDDTQALSIAQIARMCSVSEVYFRKLFKEYSGMSPTEYRIKGKIRRAKNYLTQEDISIAEISDLLGFGEVSYFIRVFKKYAGCTPREYRVKR